MRDPERRALHWPASWRWCCTACSGTESTSFLARQRQSWPAEEEGVKGCNKTGFRAGHTISPPEQSPFAGTMDGLGRSEVSSPSGLRVSRLANRSSADPIKQRPRVDCGQKQALGEGLGSKGIDSLKPVTEDLHSAFCWATAHSPCHTRSGRKPAHLVDEPSP